MPTITKVVVSASTGFNHPHEQFANFKPSVTLEAQLEVGDDYYKVVRELQDRAETLVQSHKEEVLADLERIRAIERVKENLDYALERQKQHKDNAETVERFQKELDDLLGQQATQHMITQGPIIDEVGADEFSEEFGDVEDGSAVAESKDVADYPEEPAPF